MTNLVVLWSDTLTWQFIGKPSLYNSLMPPCIAHSCSSHNVLHSPSNLTFEVYAKVCISHVTFLSIVNMYNEQLSKLYVSVLLYDYVYLQNCINHSQCTDTNAHTIVFVHNHTSNVHMHILNACEVLHIRIYKGWAVSKNGCPSSCKFYALTWR